MKLYKFENNFTKKIKIFFCIKYLRKVKKKKKFRKKKSTKITRIILKIMSEKERENKKEIPYETESE